MCGIWAILGQAKSLSADDRHALLNALRARGPEHHQLLELGEFLSLGFTRLAINGLTPEGNQPFAFGTTHVVCNGEIYNYRELADRHVMNLPKGTSDCAVIPRLFAAGLGMTETPRLIWNEENQMHACEGKQGEWVGLFLPCLRLVLEEPVRSLLARFRF